MPASHKIDKERNLVMSYALGVLNMEVILQHRSGLLADPEFDPSFSQLLDLTQVTKFDLTADDLRKLASQDLFSPKSRRAFLVPVDVGFGFSRMYEIISETAGQQGIRVFRNLQEALAWAVDGELPD
jgi:hypothetical protein